MIQVGTSLKVLDNSGATEAYCIKVKNGYKKRYATIGESILVVVKKLRSSRKDEAKAKKGEIYSGLITHIKAATRNNVGTIKSSKNSVILLNKQNKMIGTKIFGGLHHQFRYSKFLKIIFLSAGLIR